MKNFATVTLAVCVLGAGISIAGQHEDKTAVTGPSASQPVEKTAFNAPPVAGPAFPSRTPRYKVGRGDVLEITFPRVPEFSQVVSVQPDGFITLKGGAGELFVADHTVPEVMDLMKTAYAKILHEPTFTVDLKDFEKPYFTAFGEFTKPGKYDLRGDTTVVQAVSITGGFREGAKVNEILLLRRVSSEWTEVKRVDVKKMLKSGNLSEDVHLQPGDILFVSKSFMGKLDRFIPNSSIGAMVKPY